MCVCASLYGCIYERMNVCLCVYLCVFAWVYV